MLQTVATLGARDFSYSVSGFCHVFIVTGEPTLHLPRLHSSNAFKIQMFGDQNCHVRSHLERISRYLSTFKSKVAWTSLEETVVAYNCILKVV